jgi:4-hydroxybenzoate polyprenyltransferase
MWRQVQRLDIEDPAQCLKLFQSNGTVGWLIFLGLVGGGLWVALKPIV